MSFEQCQSINSLMSGFNKTWFFAGGWAFDIFIGKALLKFIVDIYVFSIDYENSSHLLAAIWCFYLSWLNYLCYFPVNLDNLIKTPNPAKKNPKQNKLAGLPQTISPIILPPIFS